MSKSKVVKPEVVTEAPKKDMGLLDKRIGDVTFETKVTIEPIYSKAKDTTYLKLTLGEAQDKVIFVSMRRDGKGVSCMTDWDAYKYQGRRPVLSQKL
jgi:hypothetical protein